MADRYREGPFAVTIEQQAVIRHLDMVTDGAATSALSVMRRNLGTVRKGAVPRWPIRSGKSRDSFGERSEVAPTQISATLFNNATDGRWGAYAYRIRWSVRTEESLDSEARDRAAEAMPYINRGRTDQARRRIAQWAYIGRPKRKTRVTTVAGRRFNNRGSSFVGMDESPTLEAMRKRFRSRLTRRHGKGAPNATLAGRQPWRELVRKPGMKLGKAMASEMQAELSALAKRGG